MLTMEIEAIHCRQVRPYRKEITLRLHLLDDGREVHCEDYTEPLGDGQTADSLRDRFRKRLQATVDAYKTEQYFLQTAQLAQVVTDLKSSVVC